MTNDLEPVMRAVRAYGIAHCSHTKERPDPGLESEVRRVVERYGAWQRAIASRPAHGDVDQGCDEHGTFTPRPIA